VLTPRALFEYGVYEGASKGEIGILAFNPATATFADASFYVALIC
jgi:hypothetical protein